MSMTRDSMICGVIFLLAFLASGHGRTLTQTFPAPPPQSGLIVPLTQVHAPINLTVTNIASSKQCVIQGYPGSTADSVVPGPLTFSLDPSIVALRTNYASAGGAAVVVYNNSRDVVLANPAPMLTQLTQADYYRDSTPTSNGYINGGLIANYAGDGSPTDPPACYVTINFVTAHSGPAPAPAMARPLTLPITPASG